jgi:hypothetical protein
VTKRGRTDVQDYIPNPIIIKQANWGFYGPRIKDVMGLQTYQAKRSANREGRFNRRPIEKRSCINIIYPD